MGLINPHKTTRGSDPIKSLVPTVKSLSSLPPGSGFPMFSRTKDRFVLGGRCPAPMPRLCQEAHGEGKGKCLAAQNSQCSFVQYCGGNFSGNLSIVVVAYTYIYNITITFDYKYSYIHPLSIHMRLVLLGLLRTVAIG